MPVPLFILGKQRSGTTWLANQLCVHSQVAGIIHKHHGGNHASLYFSHIDGRFGDLEQKTNYVELVETLAVSNTMRILEVDKAFLYSLWPTDYKGLFTAVMDRHAERQGARYWLEKSNDHTVLVDKLAELYPDARFVALNRGVQDNVSSTVGRYEMVGDRKKRLLRAAADWVRHKKTIERFAKRSERTFVTTYETLKGDPEKTLRQMCAFLGLEFEPAMLQQAYSADTTFRGGRDRSSVLTPGERRFIEGVVAVAELVPIGVLDAVAGDKTRNRRKTLPPWYFSMYPPVFKKLRNANDDAENHGGSV